jgi:hypothetical protein
MNANEKKDILKKLLTELSNDHSLPAMPMSDFIIELMNRSFDAGYDAAELDWINSHKLTSVIDD